MEKITLPKVRDKCPDIIIYASTTSGRCIRIIPADAIPPKWQRFESLPDWGYQNYLHVALERSFGMRGIEIGFYTTYAMIVPDDQKKTYRVSFTKSVIDGNADNFYRTELEQLILNNYSDSDAENTHDWKFIYPQVQPAPQRSTNENSLPKQP